MSIMPGKAMEPARRPARGSGTFYASSFPEVTELCFYGVSDLFREGPALAFDLCHLDGQLAVHSRPDQEHVALEGEAVEVAVHVRVPYRDAEVDGAIGRQRGKHGRQGWAA